MILSLRPAAQLTKDMLKEYFDQGLSPACAMSVYRDHMEMYPDAQLKSLADAARNPTARAVYYEHNKWRKQTLVSAVWSLSGKR